MAPANVHSHSVWQQQQQQLLLMQDAIDTVGQQSRLPQLISIVRASVDLLERVHGDQGLYVDGIEQHLGGSMPHHQSCCCSHTVFFSYAVMVTVLDRYICTVCCNQFHSQDVSTMHSHPAPMPSLQQ